MSVTPTPTEPFPNLADVLDPAPTFDIAPVTLSDTPIPEAHDLVPNPEPALSPTKQLNGDLHTGVEIDLAALDPAVVGELKLEDAAQDPMSTALALDIDLEPVGNGEQSSSSSSEDSYVRDYSDEQRRVKVRVPSGSLFDSHIHLLALRVKRGSVD
jgi:hypothetical protein